MNLNMIFNVIFDLMILAVLIFIAVKLHIINRLLSKIGINTFKEGQSGEKLTSGQTINVNLSPFTRDNSSVTSPVEIISETPEREELANTISSVTEDEIPEEEIEEVQKKESHHSEYENNLNVTQSGLITVKCKSCQSENSTYRRECFNCGKSL